VRVSHEFTWDSVADRLATLYARVARRRRLMTNGPSLQLLPPQRHAMALGAEL